MTNRDREPTSLKPPWDGERVVPGVPGLEGLFQFHWIRYSFAAECIDGGRVLDVGCGTGYGAHLLASSDLRAEVVGLDVSAEAIDYAQRHYRSPNLAYIVSDAYRPPLDRNSFDLIVSLEVFEHLEGAERFLTVVRWLLKPEGVFVVSTPNREVYSDGCEEPWNPYHVREFSFSEFQDLLSAEFPCVDLYGQQHAIGSLLWKGNNLTDTAIRLDLVRNHPVSEATFLIAVCSTVELSSQPPRMWVMEVEEWRRTLRRQGRHLEELSVREGNHLARIENLTEARDSLLAYREYMENLWVVRAWRHLEGIRRWFREHT